MSDDVKESMLRKIQGLLRKAANNPNEAEAKAASAKAAELMTKYNISMVETGRDPEEEMYTSSIGYKSKNLYTSPEQPFVRLILTKYFHVRTIGIVESATDYEGGLYQYSTWRIFGQTVNVEVAFYVAEFLTKTYKSLWNDYRREHTDEFNAFNNWGERFRRTFYDGLTKGLCERLDAERAQQVATPSASTALMRIDKALARKYDLAFPNRHKTEGTSIHRRDEVHNAGIDAGRKIVIRKGMTGRPNTNRPSLPRS